MRRSFIITFSAAVILVAMASPSVADIEGKADIIDGDSLSIGGQVLHLHGIDAPEPGQQCQRDGASYDCGFAATNALSFITAYQWLKCRLQPPIANGTHLATCVLGGRYDLGEKMIRQGWALAAGDAPASYQAAQGAAEREKSGLWAGAFTAPWDWRAERR